MSPSFTTTRTCSELRIASISDIHLGHAKNKAEYIIKNLYTAFPENAETGKLDIILIAGDLFDKSMMLSDDSIAEIDMWIAYMLTLCVKYDIMLIVLEGTPSHDRGQPKRVSDLNKITGINANVLYVEELSIQHIDKFGIDVLFVPDECRPTTDQILKEVLEMMAEAQLSKVDYAFMHGTFDFQVPAVATCPKHNSQAYLNIVDKLIFIGHDHTKNAFERIFAQGSFDRNTHNDEIPKGHYRAVVRSANDFTIDFIENKNARTFKTIDVCGLSIDDSMTKIESVANSVPDWSFLRVKAGKGHPILGSVITLEKKWPCITWSKLEVSEEEERRELEKIDVSIFVPVEITPANIMNLFLTRSMNMPEVSEDIIALAERKLAELK